MVDLSSAYAPRRLASMPPRVRAILDAVADEYYCTIEDLTMLYGPRVFAIARFDAMHRLSQLKRPDGVRALSLPQIGRLMGGRDHTTVLYGLRRHALAQQQQEAA